MREGDFDTVNGCHVCHWFWDSNGKDESICIVTAKYL